MKDALDASEKTAREPTGLRRMAVLLGTPERLTVIMVYKPPGRGAQEMLVTHCPFCGRKLAEP